MTSDNSNWRRRTFIKTTSAGIGVGALAGCLGGGDDDEEVDEGDTITIGAIAPLDDPLGQNIEAAAEIAAQEVNDDGGIAGAEVEIDVRDSNYDVQGTRSRYQELTQEVDSAMTMGPYVSENQMAIMGDIADQQTIHMGVAAGTPAATELIADDYETYKYFFRVGPLNGYYRGQEVLRFAEDYMDDLGWEQVAILVEDFEWTAPISEVIDGEIDQVTDAEIVTNTRFSGDTEDFSPLFDEAENEGADGILTAIAHVGTDMIVQWYDQERPMGMAGVTVPSEDPNYWDDLDGSCAYVCGSVFGGVQGSYLTDRGEEFAQTFAEADGPGPSPMYAGFHAYDAIHIFAEAVEEADGSLDPDDLIPILEDTSHDGAAGTIEFYDQDHEYPHDVKHGDDLLREMQYQWQPDGDSGQQVGIAPEEIAAGEYEQPDWI